MACKPRRVWSYVSLQGVLLTRLHAILASEPEDLASAVGIVTPESRALQKGRRLSKDENHTGKPVPFVPLGDLSMGLGPQISAKEIPLDVNRPKGPSSLSEEATTAAPSGLETSSVGSTSGQPSVPTPTKENSPVGKSRPFVPFGDLSMGLGPQISAKETPVIVTRPKKNSESAKASTEEPPSIATPAEPHRVETEVESSHRERGNSTSDGDGNHGNASSRVSGSSGSSSVATSTTTATTTMSACMTNPLLMMIYTLSPECFQACPQVCGPLFEVVMAYLDNEHLTDHICEHEGAFGCLTKSRNTKWCGLVLDQAESKLKLRIPHTEALLRQRCAANGSIAPAKVPATSDAGVLATNHSGASLATDPVPGMGPAPDASTLLPGGGRGASADGAAHSRGGKDTRPARDTHDAGGASADGAAHGRGGNHTRHSGDAHGAGNASIGGAAASNATAPPSQAHHAHCSVPHEPLGAWRGGHGADDSSLHLECVEGYMAAGGDASLACQEALPPDQHLAHCAPQRLGSAGHYRRSLQGSALFGFLCAVCVVLIVVAACWKDASQRPQAANRLVDVDVARDEME